MLLLTSLKSDPGGSAVRDNELFLMLLPFPLVHGSMVEHENLMRKKMN